MVQASRRIRDGIHVMPGTVTSCALLTCFTVLLAVFSGHEPVDMVLRPLYFAILYGSFHAIRRRDPGMASLPLRLVEFGFLVLTCGYAAAAVLRTFAIGNTDSLVQMERGAIFLLGVTLISYGIVLFVPDLLAQQRQLRERHERTKGELEEVAHSHTRMERKFAEAEGYRNLGELAAGVAHDLRNPLSIVKAAAEALGRRQRSAEDVAEHTTVIRRNVEKAERTIAALLDLGKPRTLELRTTSLRDVIAELMTLVTVEARRRGVRVETSGTDALEVDTDPRHLQRALLNLLLNALHASPSGSTVAIRTRCFTFSGGTVAAIAVTDQGSGVSEEVRQKLFTPFFTTKEEGTGLGLLSCKRILEDLGGRIGLFPRARGGARALVLLPCLPVEAAVA